MLAKYKDEIKAATIIIIALGLLTIFVITIGGASFLKSYDTYYVNFRSIGNLEPNANVRLGGIFVGKVFDVKLLDKTKGVIQVEIGIKKGTPIGDGIRASITTAGLVGDSYILLSFEQESKTLLKPKDTILSLEHIEMKDLAHKVGLAVDYARKLTEDLDKILTEKNIKEVGSLLENTNKAIVEGSKNLNEMIIALKITVAKMENVLKLTESLMDENKGDLKQAISGMKKDVEKAEKMIDSFDKTAKTLQRSVETKSRNVDEILEGLKELTDNLKEFSAELKEKPWSLLYKEGGD